MFTDRVMVKIILDNLPHPDYQIVAETYEKFMALEQTLNASDNSFPHGLDRLYQLLLSIEYALKMSLPDEELD